MRESHDQVVVRPCHQAKDFGNGLLHHQRVIAHGLKRFRNAFKDTRTVVVDRAQAAVHGFGRGNDFAAENLRHSLEAKTHTQHGHTGFEDDLPANSKVAFVFRTPRTGRENDVIRGEIEKLSPG